ncbi:MAG: hypothetical protein AAEJ04_09965 [Planctomycetota bacterium]
MTVKLDTKKARGKNITKTVKVFSNDPENPEFPLSITGTILEVLETRPLTLKLQGLAGNGLSGAFNFSAGSPLNVEILEIKGLGVGLDIGELTEVTPGREWELQLSARPNNRPAIMKEKLLFKVRTSDDVERDLEFLVAVDHRDRIVLQPKQNVKFLDRDTKKLLEDGKPIEKSILVTGGDSTVEFQVTGVKLDERISGAFATRIQEVLPGKSYRVWITLSEYQPKPTVLGKMTIETSDEIKNEISVWVMGQFRQGARKTSR